MAITPEKLNLIMERVEVRLSAVQTYLLKRIAKRIVDTFTNSDGDLFIPSTKSDLNKLLVSGMTYNEISKALETALPDMQKVIKKAFTDSSVEIAEENEILTKAMAEEAGITTIPKVDLNNLPEGLNMTRQERDILESAFNRTEGTLENLTRTTADNTQADFISVCDEAFTKAKTGVSPATAISEAIQSMAEKGITTVIYPTGHRDTIEVAIARAVRTGINQMNADITLQRCAELGTEYVKVSEHYGARVTKFNDFTNHSWWQGKIYKIDWSKPEFDDYDPNISEPKFKWMKDIQNWWKSKKTKVKYPDFIESCGYGQIQGICGINCRHTFHPYTPDLKNDENKDAQKISPEDSGKRYEKEKEARKQERAIRKTKRIIYTLESSGLTDEYTLKTIEEKKARLKEQLRQHHEFMRENGLPEENWRIEVGGDYSK